MLMQRMVELIFVCASFSKENQSRFLITARDILPRGPEDLRTQTIRWWSPK
jgi:hypothetical protein